MIVLKDIQMTLDPESIDRAIREVNLFESKLKPAMTHLIDRLAAKGVEIARAELIFFDDPAYRTGALSESIKYESKEGEASVIAGEGLESEYGSYAVFVEYGTGYYGPDIHDHGLAGWWYPAPWGWWTPSEGKYAGQKMAHTIGMAPRPFMMNTLHGLEDEAKVEGGRIIAEYLRE